jgi:hypothetical protein
MTPKIMMMTAALMLSPMATAQTAADPQTAPAATQQAEAELASVASSYVHLSLEADTHERGYVDAYFGPEVYKTAAEANPRDIPTLIAIARSLVTELDVIAPRLRAAGADPLQTRRLAALRGALVAADTRLQMIAGTRFSFAAEAQGLFATMPVLLPLTHYDAILTRLDTLVPGDGPLAARIDAFNDRYVIPTDRLRPVFDAAIAECRRRTAEHIALPAGENFTMEFVTGKPWSGYNYYQGNYRSLIQINTDLPIRISRAVDLGCHEGYPGHHVLNLLIEQRLARGRRWQDYTINPLYSPLSVISEGSANYGIDLAFPGPDRLAYERDILYPLAGLDPATAQAYWDVQQATEALGGARLTIAKLYLDGEINRVRAVELTQRYLLLSGARAEQSVAFTDRYRSYVLNYGWGRDLVRAHIEAGNPDATTRWQRMERILSEPTLPSDLLPG